MSDKRSMGIRVLLLLLFSYYSYAERQLPEYCSLYEQVYDYDFQNQDEVVNNLDQPYMNSCFKGQKVDLTYDDLLDELYTVKKSVIEEESKEFRRLLRDELVTQGYKKIQKYTKIPGIKIPDIKARRNTVHKSGEAKLQSCLGEDVTHDKDLPDSPLAYELMLSQSFKLALQAKSYIKQLAKLEKQAEEHLEEYELYDKTIQRSKVIAGMGPHGVRNPDLELKRVPEFDEAAKKVKEDLEAQKTALQAKLFEIAGEEPWLFDIDREIFSTKNFWGEKIELSSVGEKLLDGLPEDVDNATNQLTPSGMDAFYNNYRAPLNKHLNHIINDKGTKNKVTRAINNYVADNYADIKQVCMGDGERLHNFPLLVEKVMKNYDKRPGASKEDLITYQASYCHLLKTEPVEQTGVSDGLQTASWIAMGVGAGLIVTGLFFAPAAGLGVYVLGASTAVAMVDQGIILSKEWKLKNENEVAHTVGWNTLSDYVDNDNAFIEHATTEALLAVVFSKFPGEMINNYRKKISDFNKRHSENEKAVFNLQPKDYKKRLEDTHDETIDEAFTDRRQALIRSNTEWLQNFNKTYANPTFYRKYGMTKQLADVKAATGPSSKEAFKLANNELDVLLRKVKETGDKTINIDLDDADLAEAVLKKMHFNYLRTITPKKFPFEVELPVIQKDAFGDNMVINKKPGKKKKFESEEEYADYVISQRNTIDDSLYKYLLRRDGTLANADNGFKKSLDDLSMYKRYRSDLGEISEKGKQALESRRIAEKYLKHDFKKEGPLKFVVPKIKDGKVIYSKNPEKDMVEIENLPDLKDYIRTQQEAYDAVFATTRTQEALGLSELSGRLLDQAQVRRKLQFTLQELKKVPLRERSYKQQRMYLEIDSALKDPKLFPRDKEREAIQRMELGSEMREVGRRAINRLSFGLVGKHPDDPASKLRRIVDGSSYLAGVASVGYWAWNETKWEVEDALQSSDLGRVKAYFSENLSVARRSVFGASDEEMQCASEIRGFSFSVCLLPLLKKYLMVEYTKRKKNPSYDILTDEIAKRKTIDYLKYLLDLRNFRGDSSIVHLAKTYGVYAQKLSSANLLVKAIKDAQGASKKDVSLAHRFLIENNRDKKDEILLEIMETNPSFAQILYDAEEQGLGKTMQEYGDLPVSIKQQINQLVDTAKSEESELSLVKILEKDTKEERLEEVIEMGRDLEVD